MARVSVSQRNNVKVSGRGTQPMLFAPAFEDGNALWLFRYAGHGGSDLRAYDRARYATLDGYAGDVLEICRELALREVVFVGHSVSSMIGVIAAIREPERFARLVLIGP